MVAAALTGIASSLHSSRRHWTEWNATDDCGKTEGSSGRCCILSIICSIRRRCFVDRSEFIKPVELQQEACAFQRKKYSIGSGISRKQSRGEMDLQTVLPNASFLTVD